MPKTNPTPIAAPTTSPTDFVIDCACEDARWQNLQAALVRHAIFALDWLGLPPQSKAQLSLKLIDDAAMAALNARYRNQQGATNVLAFPAHDFDISAPLVRDFAAPSVRDFAAPSARDFSAPSAHDLSAPLVRDFAATETDGVLPKDILLGDVVLAYDRVAREAMSANIALATHALHLLTHGVLHLLGYRHDTAQNAAIMEGLESDLLLAANQPDPYVRPIYEKEKPREQSFPPTP